VSIGQRELDLKLVRSGYKDGPVRWLMSPFVRTAEDGSGLRWD
jgi:hypothetical protein